jgi:hypothetical protein
MPATQEWPDSRKLASSPLIIHHVVHLGKCLRSRGPLSNSARGTLRAPSMASFCLGLFPQKEIGRRRPFAQSERQSEARVVAHQMLLKLAGKEPLN